MRARTLLLYALIVAVGAILLTAALLWGDPGECVNLSYLPTHCGK